MATTTTYTGCTPCCVPDDPGCQACCPYGLPATMVLTNSGGSGCAAGFNGTFSMVYTSSVTGVPGFTGSGWVWSGTMGGLPFTWIWACQHSCSGQFDLLGYTTSCTPNLETYGLCLTASSCNPFSFGPSLYTTFSNQCCGTASFNISVTAAALSPVVDCVPCSTCTQCPAICGKWTLTVSGIGQASTAHCSAGTCAFMNGTFTLVQQVGCNFTTGLQVCNFGGVGGVTRPAWQLVYDSTHTKWTLIGAGSFVWSIAGGSFNCTGPNVMSFDVPLTTSADCNSLPATITVSPVCVNTCTPCCTNSIATTLHVTVASNTTCPSLAGTYPIVFQPRNVTSGCVQAPNGSGVGADSLYGLWVSAYPFAALPCGTRFSFSFGCCTGGQFGLVVSFYLTGAGNPGCANVTSGLITPSSCSPFLWSASVSLPSLFTPCGCLPCGGGAVGFSVTA